MERDYFLSIINSAKIFTETPTTDNNNSLENFLKHIFEETIKLEKSLTKHNLLILLKKVLTDRDIRDSYIQTSPFYPLQRVLTEYRPSKITPNILKKAFIEPLGLNAIEANYAFGIFLPLHKQSVHLLNFIENLQKKQSDKDLEYYKWNLINSYKTVSPLHQQKITVDYLLATQNLNLEETEKLISIYRVSALAQLKAEAPHKNQHKLTILIHRG